MKRALLVATAVAVLAVPASASADTFGADLSGPVRTDVGSCASNFATTSCLITSASATPTGGFYAPFSGIVNTVRVKTGNIPQGTGQMQLVVMRSFYQNNLGDPGHPNFRCCFVQEYGPTFTPQQNAVNTITNANMGFVEDPTPASNDGNTVARGDFLALSILGSNIPLPVGDDTGPSFLSYTVPAPTPGNPPAPSPNPFGPSGEAPGFKVMMNADINSISSGGGGGGGGGGAGGANPTPPPAPPPVVPPVVPPANPVTLGGGNVLGSNATIPVTCALDTTCAGLVQLLSQATGAKAKKPTKPVVYGSGRFSVPAHQTGNAKVKLTRAGKALLKKHSSVRMVAKTTVNGQTITSSVTLKRGRTKKK